jgi:hypothetical protein
LPGLHESGARVFAVGLSQNADQNLLGSITSKTNGLTQVVNKAQDLDAIFYSTFKTFIPVNATPIVLNKDLTRTILVDSSLDALTLVLNKSDHVSDLFLTDPSGNKKSIKELVSNKTSNAGYLLIELNKPKPGAWILSGPKQALEQAIILSSINLLSNFISGPYFQGELVPLGVHLSHAKQLEALDQFLEHTNISATMFGEDTHYTYTLSNKGNGVFKKTLYLNYPIGFYKLTVTATTPLFLREVEFVLDILDSPVRTTARDNTFTATLLRTDLIKEESVVVELKIKSSTTPVLLSKEDKTWSIDLNDFCASRPSALHQSIIFFKALTVNGRILRLQLPVPNDICSVEPKLDSQLASISWAQKAVKKEARNKPKPIKKEVKPKSHLKYWLIAALALILVSVVSYVLFTLWYKQKKRAVQQLSEHSP